MRRLALALVLAALVAVAAWARARQPRLVRVGGEANPCRCTERIEP